MMPPLHAELTHGTPKLSRVVGICFIQACNVLCTPHTVQVCTADVHEQQRIFPSNEQKHCCSQAGYSQDCITWNGEGCLSHIGGHNDEAVPRGNSPEDSVLGASG